MLRHQMLYPYLTICATQAGESDDLRHAMSPFSLFLSSFLGAKKDCSGVSSKKREKKTAFVGRIWKEPQIATAVTRRCDVIGLQMRPSKDADPELRRSTCMFTSCSVCRASVCSPG